MKTGAGKREKAVWEHSVREGRMHDQLSWEQQLRNVCETSLFAT